MNILGIDHADVANLSDDKLVQFAHDAARARRLIEALEVTVAGEVEARSKDARPGKGLAREHGAKNATELLTTVTLAPARAVRAKLRLAAATRPSTTHTGKQTPPACPAVGQALRDGALPLESAEHITRLIERTKDTASVEDAEAAEKSLVEVASGMNLGMGNNVDVPSPADQIRIMSNAWLETLDPEGALPDEKDMDRRRYFRFGGQRHGMIPVSGLVLPEVAASLGRLFDAFGNPRTNAGQQPSDSQTEAPEQGRTDKTDQRTSDTLNLVDEEGRPIDPTQVTEADLDSADRRSPDQKRHDMLATILNVALRSDQTPTLGGAPVTVMVQVKEEALTTGKGNAWLYDHEGAKTPVPLTYAQRSVCSGAIQKVFQNQEGRIVKLGTLERAFNQHQRRAITVRDGGCVIPGCTVPATWCEIHHVHEHSKGGSTHTDNGVLLCWHHHRHQSETGWTVTMKNGVPQIKAPPWLQQLWTKRQESSQDDPERSLTQNKAA